jgi:zinc D-Ala-D-Ala carboxypeptidase
MGDLSDHFSRHEFTCRGTNCCGGSSAVDDRLIQALEAFRAKVRVPLRISSGFRCLVHNREIGSTDASQHPRGYAADIRIIGGMTIQKMADVAESIEAFREGGIGLYETFIHVDVRKDGPARWTG